ncbi:hypothetical protein TRSC58_07659 [Trypanosoma rangeli SC58]|uniref:Uncharacterized protein n=1 Tax=Trypanosoma rangeli SC58 TaxID=429131 RepID=A0A061ISG0_TRYRA|nr:hypothetical protein TRSC58_07659 [Trypanosoma rangeli SC58]
MRGPSRSHVLTTPLFPQQNVQQRQETSESGRKRKREKKEEKFIPLSSKKKKDTRATTEKKKHAKKRNSEDRHYIYILFPSLAFSRHCTPRPLLLPLLANKRRKKEKKR